MNNGYIEVNGLDAVMKKPEENAAQQVFEIAYVKNGKVVYEYEDNNGRPVKPDLIKTGAFKNDKCTCDACDNTHELYDGNGRKA